MYTFCPTCSTVFAIKAEHLLAAAGRVRCGTCGQVFRAFDYVYEDLDRYSRRLPSTMPGKRFDMHMNGRMALVMLTQRSVRMRDRMTSMPPVPMTSRCPRN